MRETASGAFGLIVALGTFSAAMLGTLGCGGNIGDGSSDPDARPRAVDASLLDAAIDAPPMLIAAPCLDGDARVSDPDSGNCYLRFDEAVSWPQAQQACASIGAHLVSIDSAAEHAFLTMLAPGGETTDGWIGANDSAAEGTFVWEDGTPFGFEAWREGEPNDGATGEDCAVIESDTLEWDDRECTAGDDEMYFCEREASFG